MSTLDIPSITDDAASCDLREQLNILQDSALDKHEEYLEACTKLHSMNEEVEKISSDIKDVKAKNAQRIMQIEKVSFQNTDLKKLVAEEGRLSDSLTARQKIIEEKIGTLKAEFQYKLREYELHMSDKATKFAVAPHEYGFKKVNAEVDTLQVKAYSTAKKRCEDAKSLKKLNLQELSEAKAKAKEASVVQKLLNEKKLNRREKRLTKLVSDISQEVEMWQKEKKATLEKAEKFDLGEKLDKMKL